MGIELIFNTGFSAGLVEKVPLEEVKGLLRFEHQYIDLLRRENETGVTEACVHYHVYKEGSLAGRVDITGVYLNPKYLRCGDEFDGIGPDAEEFVKQRYPEIKQLLGYEGSLYTLLISPVLGRLGKHLVIGDGSFDYSKEYQNRKW